MSRPSDTAPPKGIAPFWREAVESQLSAGEQVLAAIETDLDDQLHFVTGCLVLTDGRLLFAARPPGENRTASHVSQWHTWQLDGSHELCIADHGGIGKLEFSQHIRTHRTLAVHRRQALGRTALQEAVRRAAGSAPTASRAEANGENEPARKCPSCGATLPPDEARLSPVLAGGRSAAGPVLDAAVALCPAVCRPDRGGLFAHSGRHGRRLGAALPDDAAYRPRAHPAAAAACRRRRQGASVSQISWYLAGFLVAIVVSWSLSWARTYVMAWVSERIAADLRNRTYAHLQRLSLEFFGGKRTGDLISRDQQRHRPHLLLPLGQPARFRHRRADDRDDGGDPAVDRSGAGAGDAAAVSADRLAGAAGARAAAARLRPRQPRLGPR